MHLNKMEKVLIKQRLKLYNKYVLIKNNLFILIIPIMLLLSGCYPVLPFTNLSDFYIPDDLYFSDTIEALDTPQKTCDYMKENFTPCENPEHDWNPYQMFVYKFGDCADYCCFAAFVANYHGYKTYLVYIISNDISAHMITVYIVNDSYNYSNWDMYICKQAESIKEILDGFYPVMSYTVYDCDLNIVILP